MLRRFSLWRSQVYKRILCAISKQFREHADTSLRLSAAQAENHRHAYDKQILAEKLQAAERDLEVARTAAQNATDKAVVAQAECARAQRGEIAALQQANDNLKATINSMMFAAGSQLPMFDGVGPERPPSKWDGKSIPPVNGKHRARDVARQADHDFFNQLASQIPQEVTLSE